MRKGITLIFGLVIVTCNAQSNSNQPVKNFDALCELFELNYASFEEKKIDWKARCTQFRKRVSANTTDPELFHIMAQMLKPLNDAHVTLKAKALDSTFSAVRETRIMNEISTIPRGKRKQEIKKMTERTLTLNGFEPLVEIGPKFRGEKLFGYTKSKTVGYLRFFRSFSTYAIMNGLSLDSQLKKIFDSFKDLDAVIVDVRFNIGGDDRFSQNIAGRFLDKEMVGYYKQKRAASEFGELKTKMIKPKGKEPFLKTTVLLTNERSVSAADVLALMMRELSNTTLIGEPSNGSYSDLYEKKLPNGWKVTLSNQRYLSVNKNSYEGIGTPVDIEAKNTLKDIEQSKDSVLLSALEFLSQNQIKPK
jgi:C-terminal processing protease CtpA/Prc